MKRFLNTVTRDELQQAIAEMRKASEVSQRAIDERHQEHLQRYDKQDEVLSEIKTNVARLEGRIDGAIEAARTGRYPQVKGP